MINQDYIFICKVIFQSFKPPTKDPLLRMPSRESVLDMPEIIKLLTKLDEQLPAHMDVPALLETLSQMGLQSELNFKKITLLPEEPFC